MGSNEPVETDFRKTLWRERKSRDWSQAHMAKLLCEKGLAIYPTTVAKIEAGERAARLDEVVAIADILGVSIDALVGRSADHRVGDKTLALNALTDVIQHAVWEVGVLRSGLHNRIADLDACDDLVRDESALLSAAKRADAALDGAAGALRDAHKQVGKVQLARVQGRIIRGEK